MSRRFVVMVTAAIGAIALAGVAVATPPSGVLSGTIVARGLFQTPVDVKIKVDHGSQEVIHVPDTRQMVMQQIVLAPGGHTGWHSHPGPAIALIKSGTFTLYDGETPGCAPRTLIAGEAFVDSGQGHVHLGRNLSTTENVEVWVTYFDVPPGGSVRVDQLDPLC